MSRLDMLSCDGCGAVCSAEDELGWYDIRLPWRLGRGDTIVHQHACCAQCLLALAAIQPGASDSERRRARRVHRQLATGLSGLPSVEEDRTTVLSPEFIEDWVVIRSATKWMMQPSASTPEDFEEAARFNAELIRDSMLVMEVRCHETDGLAGHVVDVSFRGDLDVITIPLEYLDVPYSF